MYAEVKCFNDDGTPITILPYRVPASDITQDYIGKRNDKYGYTVVRYTFKFQMCKQEEFKSEHMG